MRPTSLSVRDFRPLPRALPADTGAPLGARRTLPYPKNEPLYARGGANASARCPARPAGAACSRPVQGVRRPRGFLNKTNRAHARQRLGARRVRAAEL